MPAADAFTFTPLPLVVLEDSAPHQVCRLQLPENLAPEARVDLVREGQTWSWTGEDLRHDLLLPEVDAPVTGRAMLSSGDQEWSAEVAFAPVRRWSVFLVNHSHTDIGFTHTLHDCIDIHVKNLRLALDLIEATDGWPDASRLRWTVESAWQLQHYLRRYPEDRDRIAEAARAGLIEIEALYIHSYFDILSREQLLRSLTYAESIRHELDVPITSAMICDVPGCSWSLVDLFAAAGIRYLAMAPNNFIAPFHAQTDLKRPFFWEGPAGNRVLTWFTADPYRAYVEGAQVGFWTSLEAVENLLPARLASLETAGYPYAAVQFQLALDNRPLRLLPASIARDWNRRYLSPRIEVATTSQFFRHMEARYVDQFPVVSGEWQSSWSETSLHYPHEAALSRRNHHTLAEWQGFAALADWLNETYIPPHGAIADAFEASLLFDEHGGPKGIWLPRSDDEALAAIVQGYELFEAETIPAQAGRETALGAATGALRSGDDPVAVVWNLASWARSGPVAVDLPDGLADPAAIDEETGEPAPLVRAGDGGHLLFASDVPAFGFRRYRLVQATGTPVAWPVTAPEARVVNEEASLSNARLAITVDAAGAITSLVDRETGRELIDRAGWPGGNAFTRYRAESSGPGEGGDFWADHRVYDGIPIPGSVVSTTRLETSAIATAEQAGTASITTRAEIDGIYRWESTVTLHEEWVEVVNRLAWLDRPDHPEMLFVVFPFALEDPELRHASQLAIVDPRRQTLTGSNHDTFAIQEWVDVRSGDAGVIVSSDDLPLVDYGGINLRQFHRAVEPETGVLAFRAAAIHNAPPQPDSPWGRLPWLELRFALRPLAGPFDPQAAHRFGEEQASPLVARTLPPKHPGEWRQSTASLVRLESDTAIVGSLKPASDGRGTIVRVWEPTGQRSLARLSFPQHDLLHAWRTTPGEHDLGKLDVQDGEILLELEPFELVNLRCQVAH